MEEELVRKTREEGRAQNARNPEAELLQHQLSVAEAMQVDENRRRILAEIPDWQVREWMYLCAVDGMSEAQMRELVEAQASVPRIRQARMEALYEASDLGTLLREQVEELRGEVLHVCEENRRQRTSAGNASGEALQKQIHAQKETIQTKDALIEVLRNRVEELEARVREQQMERERTLRKAAAFPAPQAEPIPAEPVRTPLTEDPESPMGNQPDLPPEDTEPEEAASFREAVRSSFREAVTFWKKSNPHPETKRFIERFLKDEAWSEEQRSFLLDCMEEGMRVKEIEAFASPELSVEMMRRLRELRKR